MAVCIGGVALSRNPVSTNESFIISVTVKNHQYLKKIPTFRFEKVHTPADT